MVENEIWHNDQIEARYFGILCLRTKDGVKLLTPYVALITVVSARYGIPGSNVNIHWRAHVFVYRWGYYVSHCAADYLSRQRRGNLSKSPIQWHVESRLEKKEFKLLHFLRRSVQLRSQADHLQLRVPKLNHHDRVQGESLDKSRRHEKHST